MNHRLHDDIATSTIDSVVVYQTAPNPAIAVVRPDQDPLWGTALTTGVGKFDSSMLIGTGRIPPMPYTGKTPEQDTKAHNHYFKSVKGLEYVDVYRVLSLFNVTDPVLQHAAKKLLVAGGRGHKNIDKDIQDVIDSCLRWQEMRKEDKNA